MNTEQKERAIRRDERKAVWDRVFNIVSDEGSYGARQLIKSLEAAREQDGCGPATTEDSK